MLLKLRNSPPISLVVSIFQLIVGQLYVSKKYLGIDVAMHDDQSFTVFRHISKRDFSLKEETIVFIVRFKFSRLSHKANKIASVIPMLLISGFPGFNAKMYAVNQKNGYWQGMYQWKSKYHLEEYKRSFVYKMMNKRAISASLTSIEFKNTSLIQVIEQNKTNH